MANNCRWISEYECKCGETFKKIENFDTHVRHCKVVNSERECQNCKVHFECEHVSCEVKIA